jgi:RNA polymerase-binding transcription factor
MTEEEKQRIEALLQVRAEELRRNRRALRRGEDDPLDSELSHFDNHPADQATELHDQELEVTTEDILDEEEQRIEEGRRALRDGTYGVCVSCGQPIPATRLEAVPEAVRCIDCQRALEAQRRQRATGR